VVPPVKSVMVGVSLDPIKQYENFVLLKNNDELRIWPQLIFTHSYMGFTIEQGYRVEMRFITNGYRYRFRYLFGLAYNFKKLVE
jgi:hypothetical protein